MTIERREKIGPIWVTRKVWPGYRQDLWCEKRRETGLVEIGFRRVEAIGPDALRLTELNSQGEKIPDSVRDLHGVEINQLNADLQTTLHREGFFVLFGREIIFRWKE